MNHGFWRGKRVFLTGHTGFKGAWLTVWLKHMGADVTGFSLRPPSDPSLFELLSIGPEIVSVEADVRDGAQLLRSMQAASPDIVIHMAAQSLVRYGYDHPAETYSVNVMGLVNLYEAVRQTPGVRAVLNVTSDKCYENREWAWGYRENEAMGGFDPYSSSKGCAELITSAYRRSYFGSAPTAVPVGSARAGNVIGGGDWARDRLVPDIMRALAERRSVVIRHPHAIRPWQHVLEPLSGYLLLTERLYEDGSQYADGWNFGPSDADAREVQWIVDRLVTKWGAGATWNKDASVHPHEANHLKLDCSKARQVLGWQPRWSLERALDEIITWHQGLENRQSARALCLSQIQAYETTQELKSS